MLKTVNVLGTEYKIIVADEEEKPKLKALECNGYMDFSTKEIVIVKFEQDDKSIDDLENYAK